MAKRLRDIDALHLDFRSSDSSGRSRSFCVYLDCSERPHPEGLGTVLTLDNLFGQNPTESTLALISINNEDYCLRHVESSRAGTPNAPNLRKRRRMDTESLPNLDYYHERENDYYQNGFTPHVQYHYINHPLYFSDLYYTNTNYFDDPANRNYPAQLAERKIFHELQLSVLVHERDENGTIRSKLVPVKLFDEFEGSEKSWAPSRYNLFHLRDGHDYIACDYGNKYLILKL